MTNRACCLDTLSKSYGVPWSKKEIGGNCGIPGIFIVECYIYIYDNIMRHLNQLTTP